MQSKIYKHSAGIKIREFHSNLSIHFLNKHSKTIMMTSYILERLFGVEQEIQYSELKQIKDSIPHGSISGPTYFLLKIEETVIA